MPSERDFSENKRRLNHEEIDLSLPSDILGKSGKAIIEAILEGNHDPQVTCPVGGPVLKGQQGNVTALQKNI
jgi:hypothetical protein